MVGVEGRGFGDGVEGFGKEMKQVRPTMGRHQLGEWGGDSLPCNSPSSRAFRGPLRVVPFTTQHSSGVGEAAVGGSTGSLGPFAIGIGPEMA